MAFPVEITFRGMERSDAAERDVAAWADKLAEAFDRIIRCDVVVEAPHHHHRQGRQHHVRIVLSVPGDTIVISHEGPHDRAHEDLHVAIRDAFHAARRRLEDWVRRDLRHREEPDEAHGRVAYVDVEGAWGYLDAPDGHRVYFHRNAVVGAGQTLPIAVGDEVRFTEEAGEQGPQASSVVPLGAHAHHELPR